MMINMQKIIEEHMLTKFILIFVILNLLEDGAECKSFAIIFIDSLLVYENKNYLQLYLDNCAYKILNTQMIDYLDDNLLEFDEN